MYLPRIKKSRGGVLGKDFNEVIGYSSRTFSISRTDVQTWGILYHNSHLPKKPFSPSPPFLEEEISISFCNINCSRVKTGKYLHLYFSRKTSYLLPPTCVWWSTLHHRSITAISGVMDACSGPVLYHSNWLSGKENGDVYTSPMQTPIRHPKMLVVSSQTWN